MVVSIHDQLLYRDPAQRLDEMNTRKVLTHSVFFSAGSSVPVPGVWSKCLRAGDSRPWSTVREGEDPKQM